MNDDAALLGCRRREPAALVRRYAGAVRFVIGGVINDPDEVEDAFQETFLALADPSIFLRVRDPSSPRGYVLTIVCGRATDPLRRRYRDADRRELLKREVDPSPSLEPTDSGFPGFEELLSLLPGSEAGRRGALLLRLRYKDSLSYDEIASRTGIPRGSIGPTIARALGKLARPVRRRVGDAQR
ncbi:MAG: hypothetical protein CME06_15595 [Gemmatimonadetes bacterium]|nr:hypothetical protein [Gemmatimonadota bacterium]